MGTLVYANFVSAHRRTCVSFIFSNGSEVVLFVWGCHLELVVLSILFLLIGIGQVNAQLLASFSGQRMQIGVAYTRVLVV